MPRRQRRRFCRPSIRARICGTRRCLDPAAPSTPPATSSFRSTCSEMGIPRRRAIRVAPQDGPRFPHVTLFDNVACQHRLLTECSAFDASRWYSAGRWRRMQAYQWAAQYPGHGRRDPSLLRRRALLSPQPCLPRRTQGGVAGRCRLERRQLREAAGEGLTSFRAASTSPGPIPIDFFSDGLYRAARFRHAGRLRSRLGGGSPEMGRERSDRQDLDLAAWQTSATIRSIAVISTRALQSIRARAIVMPCSTDMYFVPEDNAAEVGQDAARRAARLRLAMGPLRGLAGQGSRVPTGARRSRRRIVERMRHEGSRAVVKSAPQRQLRAARRGRQRWVGGSRS